jgi:hypothetical protein
MISIACEFGLTCSPKFQPGAGYKDFGSFKLCGEGRFPKTFLSQGQAAQGEKL